MWNGVVHNRTSYPDPRLPDAWPDKAPRRLENFGLRDTFKLNKDLDRVMSKIMPIKGRKEVMGTGYMVDTAAALGVQDAAQTLRGLFPSWNKYSLRPTLNRAAVKGMHLWERDLALNWVVALGVVGGWDAHFAWDRMQNLLVLGGWPWLVGYPKVYAKTIFTLMACISAAVEMGQLNGAAMREPMQTLAERLVMRESIGGPWRIRTTWKITSPKAMVSAVLQRRVGYCSPHRALGPSHTLRKLTSLTLSQDSAKTEGADAPNQAVKPEHDIPWTAAPFTPNSESLPRNHVIPGKDCNHGAELLWAGRVQIAHSMMEVITFLGQGDEQITVALTRGDEMARDEVETYAVAQKILSVKRSSNQCISCICKLAHVVGALLVIG